MNDDVTAPQVRVINEEGKQVGVVPISEAKKLAQDAGLDLVEIVPNAKPPVCKIIDYGKYKYELGKKEKLMKKKQHVIHVKEIRLSPKIEEHDFNFKVGHARKFLEQGNKVKVNILFRGRQITHIEFGREVIDKFANELEDIAKLEMGPKVEGRNMVAIFVKK
ncbi:MAG: translation initiation factor IF-3 [Calditrichaeota bacterium]|nr:translation initiation factor IF-3 [Calditrichota bacterium]